VVTDPYAAFVGWSMPAVSADVITVSHDHEDHNAIDNVKGTARREKPFIIDQPGEYEVGGVSVFGTKSFHDENGGVERGTNTIYTVFMDGVRVCHLGDLGHELNETQLSEIGQVDVVLCPVGGHFTIDPQTALKVIRTLEPSYVVPMHFNTDQHDPKVFADMSSLADFIKAYGVEAAPVEKLSLDKTRLPEETELVVLAPHA
jgi:L-ascorbate metabolism protein UlaG (beta-lactamase superfamily)